MLVYEKTSIYLAIELSLREISYVLYARAHLRALMTQKSCAVGMRNAKLGNHLKILLVTYKALNGLAPSNIKDLLRYENSGRPHVKILKLVASRVCG